MYNLLRHFWITISVSTLTIVSSNPVLAKTPAHAKIVVASQVGNKTHVRDEILSLPPVDAILASVKPKPSIHQKLSRFPQYQGVNRRSTAKVKHVNTGHHLSEDPSFQGIANLIDADRNSRRADNFSAISQLIE